MQLELTSSYKSLIKLQIEDYLPDFSIITGSNGGGKTHFLEAIDRGNLSASINGEELTSIYRSNATLLPIDKTCNPNDIKAAKAMFCEEVMKIKQIAENSCTPNSLHTNLDPRKQLFHIKEIEAYWNGLMDSSNPKYEELEKLKSSFFKLTFESNLSRFIKESENTKNKNLIQQYYILFAYLRLFDKKKSTFAGAKFAIDYALNLKGKTHELMNHEDLEEGLPNPVEVDPFQAFISDWIIDYTERYDNFVLTQFKIENLETRSEIDKVFEERNGRKPWKEIDELCQLSGFDLKVVPPKNNASSYSLSFENSKGIVIPVDSLSSGEKLLISLTPVITSNIRKSRSGCMPDLLLLDEIDASLHPQLTDTLLRVLKKFVIERHGSKIILVTHSPSTVAIADEESIYTLESSAGEKRLIKSTRDETLSILTKGIPSLSINVENRRQIIVESQYDEKLYSNIYQNIKSNLENRDISLAFISAGGKGKSKGGCTMVKSLVEQLRENGNKSVFGIIDYDNKNTTNDEVKVLAEKERYAIENCILDPLLISMLILKMSKKDSSHFGCSSNFRYVDALKQSPEDLQELIDKVTEKIFIEDGVLSGEKKSINYLNGLSLECDEVFLTMQGHELEDDHLRKNLQMYVGPLHQTNAIKNEITNAVLADFPGFTPILFLTLFNSLQA